MCWITFDVKSRLEPLLMIHCWCVFGHHSPHVIAIFPNMTRRKSMQVRNIFGFGNFWIWMTQSFFKLNIYREKTKKFYLLFVAVYVRPWRTQWIAFRYMKAEKKEQKDINSEGQHNVKRIKTLPENSSSRIVSLQRHWHR